MGVGWQLAIAAAALFELGVQLPELRLRADTFKAARAFADGRGKPLLNIGCLNPLKQWWHPCGDVCVDLDPTKASSCRAPVFQCLSVLSLPFASGYFGAATCFHVLEHLKSIDDVRTALHELERVADRVFVLVPARGLRATFHEDHHLWLDPVQGGYLVTDRTTGDRQFVAVRDPQTGSAYQLISAVAA